MCVCEIRDGFVIVSEKWQVYVGLDPPYWTLDPEKLERAFSGKTKAIVLNRFGCW